MRVDRCAAGDVEIPLDGLRSVSRLDAGAVRGARSYRGIPAMLVRDVAHGKYVSPVLGEFRLFAWRAGPYVLLEGRFGKIVLTPDDPEAFVAALRAGLARP